MADFTKPEMRTLRRLVEVAWDSELREVLEQLHEAFGKWEQGEISSFDLSEKIHEFHDGDARHLYKLYTGLHPSQAVARALAHGYLEASEVPDSLLNKLTPAVTFFSQDLKRTP